MNLLRSEWTKLRSVRSTWAIAVSAIVAGIALGLLGASLASTTPVSELPSTWDPTALSMKGILFVQLLIGMLGAHSVTAEHDTGMIGTSLSATPSRSRFLLAKTVVTCLFALLTSETTVILSFAVVQLSLMNAGLPAASILTPAVIAALLGAILYLTLIALIGVAIGALTRSTTASLAALVGILLLVPAIGPGLPGGLGEWFAQYWPVTAGQAAYTVIPVDGVVLPAVGLGILAIAALAAYLAGHVSLRTRDV